MRLEKCAAVPKGMAGTTKKYKSIYDVPNIWVMNVESAAIDEVAYSPERLELYVNFSSSTMTKWYMYEGVTVKTFVDFTKATSKGGFFATKIKGKYDFTIIEP